LVSEFVRLASPATQAGVQRSERVPGDLVVQVPAARHGIHDAPQVLVLDGGGQFAGEVIVDRHQVKLQACGHECSLSLRAVCLQAIRRSFRHVHFSGRDQLEASTFQSEMG
jgi:hypothetical protein